MLEFANNQHYTAIAADLAVAGNPTAGTVATPANLPSGGVVVVNEGNVVLSSIPASGTYRIAQGQGADKELLLSPVIVASEATVTSHKHVSAAQQITLIGYNGTSGSLPSANDTSYFIVIEKEDNDEGNRAGYYPSITAQYKTSAAASQQELAFGLLSGLAANLALEAVKYSYARPEVLTDDITPTAVAGAHATVVKGSKNVTFALAHTLSLGDVISIAGAAYEVAEVVSTTVVNLSTPYMDASGTVNAGTTFATEWGTISPTNFGVTLTGLENPFDVVSMRDYYTNRFYVKFMQGESPAGAAVTTTQNASDGIGSWQKAQFSEYQSYGFYGDRREVLNVPPGTRPQFAVKNAEYSVIHIKTSTKVNSFLTSGNVSTSYKMYLELDGSSELSGTSQGDALATILIPGFSTGDLDK